MAWNFSYATTFKLHDPANIKDTSNLKSNGHSFRASWQGLQAEPWHYSNLVMLLCILKLGHFPLPLETLHNFQLHGVNMLSVRGDFCQ